MLPNQPAWDLRANLNCLDTKEKQHEAKVVNAWLRKKLLANANDTADQLQDEDVGGKKQTLRQMVDRNNLVWVHTASAAMPWWVEPISMENRERIFGLDPGWTRGTAAERARMLGNRQQTRCALIQPVDEAFKRLIGVPWPRRCAPLTGRCIEVEGDCILNRDACDLHSHTRRLVYRQHVIIFEDDVQRDVKRHNRPMRCWFCSEQCCASTKP